MISAHHNAHSLIIHEILSAQGIIRAEKNTFLLRRLCPAQICCAGIQAEPVFRGAGSAHRETDTQGILVAPHAGGLELSIAGDSEDIAPEVLVTQTGGIVVVAIVHSSLTHQWFRELELHDLLITVRA